MFAITTEWHDGEKDMRSLLKVPEPENATVAALSQKLAVMLQRAPLLAIGCVDGDHNPWVTVWGGDAGLAAAIGGNLMGVRTTVEAKFDPVVQTLVRGYTDGEMVREEGRGRMVGGLSIDLEQRNRVKLYGRMVAGSVRGAPTTEKDDQAPDDAKKEKGQDSIELQLVVKVEESLGNCPKYLNRKTLKPSAPSPSLISQSIKLPKEAVDLINRVDLFFIASTRAAEDMDTNHRGGPPGFTRVASNDETGAEIVYPEYSGNRYYQTLGNLRTTPKAGLVFPDFETGDVLYVTGKTNILIGQGAAEILPQSKLAVSIKLTAAKFVRNGLPFRGEHGERSPYNPTVRLLASEGSLAANFQESTNSARLVDRMQITPTIFRYRFAATNLLHHEAGQWVALDFSHELDLGYSHMRDDDPRSLNDDWIRTFTVSSPPGKPADGQFEITARTVGPVTEFLSKIRRWQDIEVPIKGFGGDYRLQAAPESDELLPFVAGGIGITPLLGQLPGIDLTKLQLFWTMRLEDIDLAVEVLSSHPGLGGSAKLFFTGAPSQLRENQKAAVELLRQGGAKVENRRLLNEDLDAVESHTWYLCAATGLEKALSEMLKGKNIVCESFNY